MEAAWRQLTETLMIYYLMMNNLKKDGNGLIWIK